MCDFQSKFRQFSSYFANFCDIMSKRQHYNFKEVLDEVFVDECSNSDPYFADSLSNSNEQVSKTCWQDSVKIATVFTLTSMLQIHDLQHLK